MKDTIKDHIGDVFKSYRQEKGLTREDVAQALCLDKALVSALELGEFPDAISPAYLKLYVRSYARFLGIDETEAQDNFKKLYQSKPRGNASRPEFQKEDVFLSPVPTSTRFWLHTLTVSVLGFCALILWYHHITTKNGGEFWPFHFKKKTPSELSVTSDVPLNLTKKETVDETNSTDLNDNKKINETRSPDKSKISALVSDPTNENTSQQENISQQKNTSQQENTIVSEYAKIEIEFTDDCWVSIKDGNGKRLAIGLMKKGKHLSLNGKRPFKLVLGNAGAVKILLDGKPQDTSGFRKNQVAKFVVGKR